MEISVSTEGKQTNSRELFKISGINLPEIKFLKPYFNKLHF